MAKGVEDTAFYRYLRLVALNEVGGDPGRFSLRVDAFHRAQPRARRRAYRVSCSPRRRTTPSAAATSAHGSARSPGCAPEWGDARARLARAATRRCARPGAGRQRGVPDLPDAGRCLADRAPSGSRRTWRRRCARRAATPAGPSPTRRWERSVARRSPPRSTSTSRSSPRSSRSPQRSSRPASDAALGALLLRLTCPGRARHLPGRRAVVAGARRPGQPPAGRLGRPSRAHSPPRAAGAPPQRDAQAAPDPRGARAARPPPRAVRRRLQPLPAPDRRVRVHPRRSDRGRSSGCGRQRA